ncbi:MAG: CoA-binding protein [Bauldia sp.]
MSETYADDELRSILERTRIIALVGASPKPRRPANSVMGYLLGAGYRVIPVNPRHARGEILGQPVYASLAEVPEAIDLVDIFRRRDALAGVVDEALGLRPKPAVIWMQLGLIDEVAAARARAAGVTVVMDRCTMVEHRRLISRQG